MSWASDVDTLIDNPDNWYATTGGVAYYVGRKGDYYSLGADSLNVSYTNSVPSNKKAELSDIKGTLAAPTADSVIGLSADNFDGNVNFVGNDGKERGHKHYHYRRRRF